MTCTCDQNIECFIDKLCPAHGTEPATSGNSDLLCLKSEGKFHVKGRGTAYTTRSPVTCERTTRAFIEAIGSDRVKIDGIEHGIAAIEMFMPGTPLSVGEPIGILTRT